MADQERNEQATKAKDERVDESLEDLTPTDQDAQTVRAGRDPATGLPTGKRMH